MDKQATGLLARRRLPIKSILIFLWAGKLSSGVCELGHAGIEPVGDSHENALAETINVLYKIEVAPRRGPWRSFEAVAFATLEWIDWFNNRPWMEPIGYSRTAEAKHRRASWDRVKVRAASEHAR